jgi:hypothetical protein
MKKLTLTLAAVAMAASVFGQGQINFNNRVVVDQGGLGTVNSPIFGPEVGDPALSKRGGTPTGDPAGTETYTGPRLAGTGFTAQLWYAAGNDQSEASLQAATVGGITSFRTGSGNGYVTATTATLPGVTAGRVTLQVRVWDNMGGTVLTWDQALARLDVAKGVSNLFNSIQDVGFGTVNPPTLDGLQSFNIAVVPEPSTIALGILGGLGTLVLLRRRK